MDLQARLDSAGRKRNIAERSNQVFANFELQLGPAINDEITEPWLHLKYLHNPLQLLQT